MKKSKVKIVFKDTNGDRVKTVTNVDFKNAKSVALSIISRNDHLVTYYITHMNGKERKPHIDKFMYQIELTDNEILVYKIDYDFEKFRTNSDIFLNVNDIRVHFRNNRRNKTFEERLKITCTFK